MMNRMCRILIILLAAFTTLRCNEAAYAGGDGKHGVRVRTIAELNCDDEPFDSHAGDELFGVLEPMAKYMQTIPASVLGCETPIYARVKKLADGSYFLMYQNSKIASTIFYSRSDDLLTWSHGKELFSPVGIIAPDGGKDIRKYSSGDATVLANGDLIAYAAFRANAKYRYYPERNGIMMRRSTDNGATWSDEQVIYSGTNWEPYVLQLPSGELQCYFTDTNPKKRNSGTSMVVSTDNGESWSPTGTSNCYKVIRQYKYDYNGTPIYTDQMPCVRLLNDGHTLLGIVEARLEGSISEKESTFKMSLVYGKDRWKYLAEGETGPDDRQSNLFNGAAGYAAQFRSGETLISCNIANILSLKLGTADGRSFRGSSWESDWYQPFPEKGYWGSVEVIGSHEMLATIHSSDGIQLGRFYLNHRIDAPEIVVATDGDNAEWKHTQALFIGSTDADVQTAVRAAHDDKNLYLLFDRSDRNLKTDDLTEIYLCRGREGKSLDAEALKIVVSPRKILSAARYDGTMWHATRLPKGVRYAATVAGTLDDDNDDEGCVAELKIPLSAIGSVEDDYVRIMTVVKNDATEDTFTSCRCDEPENWIRIRLK